MSRSVLFQALRALLILLGVAVLALLAATLYAGIRSDMLDAPFMRDFLLTAKDTSFATLEGVSAARG